MARDINRIKIYSTQRWVHLFDARFSIEDRLGARIFKRMTASDLFVEDFCC